MREVTVYTLEASKVVVHNPQQHIERFHLGGTSPVLCSDGEYVIAEECAYKKILLPVRRYSTVGRQDIYIAFDPEILKLLSISEECVEAQLSVYRKEMDRLSKELVESKSMTFWQTVKLAFEKLRSN